MKILLAPSERKTVGGDNPPISKNSFCFEKVYDKRIEAIKIYDKKINQFLSFLLSLLYYWIKKKF